jgi:3-deoxy-manno-octulosonate cytidylyltransferase (CMP-KDO synthetase)
VVLTDDERIADLVAGFGGEALMTPEACVSGTDRIAWAARGWDAPAVINIQGDEPLIDPEGIEKLARHLIEHPEDPMSTLAAPLRDGDLDNPNVVKVVLDRQGYGLYFSRASIPYPRRPGIAPSWQHLGIYGYRSDVLQKLAGLEPTPLEQCESLEQLRALENGISIRVLTLAHHAHAGVDTAEDLARVEAVLRAAEAGDP